MDDLEAQHMGSDSAGRMPCSMRFGSAAKVLAKLSTTESQSALQRLCLDFGYLMEQSSSLRRQRMLDICSIQELPEGHPAVATGRRQERLRERGLFAAQVIWQLYSSV